MNETTELPAETREFLARLRAEDLKTLEDGIRLMVAIQVVGKFSKWLIITIVGFIFGAVMLWESILKVISWIKGG
jgi:hypothetical protein